MPTTGKTLMQNKITPDISVVVASHRPGHAETLAAHLLTIETSVAKEIIFVADYPVDVLCMKFPSAQWLFCKDKSIPVKRNIGCKEATGILIAFTDDDCLPEKDWLKNGWLYHTQHPEYAGFCGKTIVRHNAVFAPHKEFNRLELPGFRTNNMFYKRDILCALGGFDERFSFQREDADLAFTSTTSGCKIGYCDNAVVCHETRKNEKWDLLKNCWNRRFDPLLYKKHKALYRKHIGSPFPPGIALILFFQLAMSVSAFAMPCLCIFNAGIAVFISAGLALRRNNFLQNGSVWLLRDICSFVASPAVLASALTWGNVKFKSFLWI